jgi:hypothetical protein
MAMAWVVTVDIFSCARVTPGSSQREPTIRRGGGGAGGRDRGAQPRGFGCSSRSYAGAGTHSVGGGAASTSVGGFLLGASRVSQTRSCSRGVTAKCQSRRNRPFYQNPPLRQLVRSTRLSTSSSHDTREFSVSVLVSMFFNRSRSECIAPHMSASACRTLAADGCARTASPAARWAAHTGWAAASAPVVAAAAAAAGQVARPPPRAMPRFAHTTSMPM